MREVDECRIARESFFFFFNDSTAVLEVCKCIFKYSAQVVRFITPFRLLQMVNLLNLSIHLFIDSLTIGTSAFCFPQ